MAELAEKYMIPPEVAAFVANGFLQVVSEDAERATVEFDIPSLGYAESDGRYALYCLVWINPERNAEFCHSYLETPGDLPNFYVRIDTDHSRDDQVDDLESVDDLVDWLEEKQEAKKQ
jgi:hypothetical protein